MIGFGLALIMGIVLGLIGGGGSILTVPILVYFFKINATLATSYSLFVVGITSLIGAIRYKKTVKFSSSVILRNPFNYWCIINENIRFSAHARHH